MSTTSPPKQQRSAIHAAPAHTSGKLLGWVWAMLVSMLALASGCAPANDDSARDGGIDAPPTPAALDGSNEANSDSNTMPSLDIKAAKAKIKEAVAATNAPDEIEGETPLLPDLFAEPPDPASLRVNTKLLTNEEAATLSERVDGVEVKVEVRTQ